MAEHAAYSTHYCSQEQGSEEDEEEEVMSLGELTNSLQVELQLTCHNTQHTVMINCITTEIEPCLLLPPCTAFVSSSDASVSLWQQAAEESQRRLQREVTAFLSLVKNDALLQSKTRYYYFIHTVK